MWPATNIKPSLQRDSPRANESTIGSFIDHARSIASAIASALYLGNDRLLHSANLHTEHGPGSRKISGLPPATNYVAYTIMRCLVRLFLVPLSMARLLFSFGLFTALTKPCR